MGQSGTRSAVGSSGPTRAGSLESTVLPEIEPLKLREYSVTIPVLQADELIAIDWNENVAFIFVLVHQERDELPLRRPFDAGLD